jgi:hypothetical protein
LHAAIATYTATALDGIDDRAKLEQHAVAGGLHEPSAVLRYESVGDRAVFAEGAGGTDLVQPHEPRVSRHVSYNDCRQPRPTRTGCSCSMSSTSRWRNILYKRNRGQGHRWPLSG